MAHDAKTHDGLNILSKIIDKELEKAILDLDKNTGSNKVTVEKLQHKLQEIWVEIKTQGYSQKHGLDPEWRGAFVCLQGIIEKSQAIALKTKRLKSAEGFIVTPRMPTPLMLASGKSFQNIVAGNPSDYAALRRMILEEYLASGARLNAVYSQDASSLLSDEKSGLAIYRSTLKTFAANLKDHPIIKIPMKEFPMEKAGAIYYLNNDAEQVISIQSYQLSQLQKSSKHKITWSIRFGSEAKSRAEEINKFLEDNGAPQLVRR
jgi:hypothetical protein